MKGSKRRRNKEYPYRQKRLRGSLFVNQRDTYGIVNKEGKVIEKFRLKTAATNYLLKISKNELKEDHKIVVL